MLLVCKLGSYKLPLPLCKQNGALQWQGYLPSWTETSAYLRSKALSWYKSIFQPVSLYWFMPWPFLNTHTLRSRFLFMVAVVLKKLTEIEKLNWVFEMLHAFMSFFLIAVVILIVNWLCGAYGSIIGIKLVGKVDPMNGTLAEPSTKFLTFPWVQKNTLENFMRYFKILAILV